MAETYLIALGSNRRHHRHGPPERIIAAALAALEDAGITVVRAGPVVRSAPLGPSLRRYANSAAVIRTELQPLELLGRLKSIERRFGRRAGGQRWSSRVLDLDIVLWSGGCWSNDRLTVPHRLFRERAFVLGPALPIAGDWRDPITNLTLRQLSARLTQPIPAPKRAVTLDPKRPAP